MAYELRHVCASYEGEAVLEDLTLSLEPESITVILGPSGCGKTTLLNLIAGLKEADSGERLGFESCRFSYAFQEPRLLPWLDCRANIDFALSGIASPSASEENTARASGLDQQTLQERIDHFLTISGLDEVASRLPSELSGGMRQRLSLARAFAYPSDMLLLDEAFQAVDLRMKLELMDSFLELWRDERRTVVCVTHDVEEAAYLADRAVALSPRPARIVDSFSVDAPRSERSLGSTATMGAAARLYRHALGQRY